MIITLNYNIEGGIVTGHLFLFYNYPFTYQFFILYPEYQFVYPDPKGSELIVSAPFRAGVN
jgi:hypothetical protein